MQVPLESWQIGPHNRWAYQHVDEVVPTVAVSRGDGPVRELPSRPARLDVDDPPYLDGLAVLRDGVLVEERYRNGMDAATLHLSQSVGKSVLGLLVLKLGIDPGTPVVEVVPEIAGSAWITGEHTFLIDADDPLRAGFRL